MMLMGFLLLLFATFCTFINAAHEGVLFEYHPHRNCFGAEREYIYNPSGRTADGSNSKKLVRGDSCFIPNDNIDEELITSHVYIESGKMYLMRHIRKRLIVNDEFCEFSSYIKSSWYTVPSCALTNTEGVYEFQDGKLYKLDSEFGHELENAPDSDFPGIKEQDSLLTDIYNDKDGLFYHVAYNSLIKDLNLKSFQFSDNEIFELEKALNKRLGNSIDLNVVRFPFYLDFDFRRFNLYELEMRDRVGGGLHRLPGDEYERLGGGNRMDLIFSYPKAENCDWIWIVDENGRSSDAARKIRTIVVTEKNSDFSDDDRSVAEDASLLEKLGEAKFSNALYLLALINDPSIKFRGDRLLCLSDKKEKYRYKRAFDYYESAAKIDKIIYYRMHDFYTDAPKKEKENFNNDEEINYISNVPDPYKLYRISRQSRVETERLQARNAIWRNAFFSVIMYGLCVGFFEYLKNPDLNPPSARVPVSLTHDW